MKVSASLLSLLGLLLFSPRSQAADSAIENRLAVLNGLEIWFDCAQQNPQRSSMGLAPLGPGVKVDYLFDSSGHRRVLAQPYRESRPTFRQELGQSFLAFDGKNSAMSAFGWGVRMQNLTLFLVASPHSNAGLFRAPFSFNRAGMNDYTSGLNLDLGPNPTAQLSQLSVEGAGCPGSSQLLKSSGLPFGGWHLVTLESKVGTQSVQLGFDGLAQGSRDRGISEIAMDDFVLGGRLYSNIGEPPYIQGNFHGQIAELLLYSRSLSDEERKAVENYLKSKYTALLTRSPRLEDDTKPWVTVTNPPPVQFLVPGFVARELPLSLKNVNCIKYRPDGKLVALRYDGGIDLLEDSDGDGLEDRVRPFWTNNTLRAPIGMALTPPNYSKGVGAFVAAKGKVSLIVDTNGDDRADAEWIVADGWKEISHGVDALGVAIDREENVFFGLGTANFTDAYLLDKTTGKARYDLKSERGTILKVSPDFKRREIVCTGIRFPVALAFNRGGDLFCTDQEGATWLPNGNPLDELLHIEKGRHYGFPPQHPKYLPEVIDEPSVFDYSPQHESTCGLNFNEPVQGESVFGPPSWRGDAFVCGYSRGKIWRTRLVKTAVGYVGQSQIIASVPTLAVDACVSTTGELVLATHGGEPDWGSGPDGVGHLYKITYQQRELAQPVLAWAVSPSELRIGFDRALTSAQLKDLKKRIEITQGAYATAGDRFEVKRPGYAVVISQMSAPRYDVPVQTVSFTPDQRTLVVHTKALLAAANYAITLRQFETRAAPIPGTLPSTPDLDILADLHGMHAVWTPSSEPSTQEPKPKSWEGWVPHLDLEISKQITQGSADHAALWPDLKHTGRLTIQGQLDLWQMLQPAIQPGAKLDYERPKEQVKVLFASHKEFNVRIAAETIASRSSSNGLHQATFAHPGQQAWVPFEISIATGNGGVDLTATWSTTVDPRQRAFALRRFLVPWARPNTDPSNPQTIESPPELAGGNWLRGKSIFFGDVVKCSGCHVVRDEGNPVGPELSNLIHRDYASVLKDIRFPNAALNPDHLAYSIQLEDGEEIAAIVQSEQKDAIRVADASGTKSFLRTQVKSMKPSGVSLMPEGLDKLLDEDQLRDLLTFLLTTPLDPSPIEISGAPQPRTRNEFQLLHSQKQAAVPSHPPPKLRILLAAGPKDHGINEHDYPLWQRRWGKLLSLSENVTVSTCQEFPTKDEMNQTDVIVFYSNNPGWSASVAGNLKQFQQRGGGLVYLHFAVDGHSDVEALAAQIGLAWRSGHSKFRHGPLSLSLDATHPIAHSLSHLELVDESYWDLDGDESGIHVVASGIEEEKRRPLMWTRENGPGRVFVSIPGHYTWTFDDPVFRAVLLRAICWTAHQPVDRLSELVPIGARIQGTSQGLEISSQIKGR